MPDIDKDEGISSVTFQYPLLEHLELTCFETADSIIVDCVGLQSFFLRSCQRVRSFVLNCPLLLELEVDDCPFYDPTQTPLRLHPLKWTHEWHYRDSYFCGDDDDDDDDDDYDHDDHYDDDEEDEDE